jgi:hypothetical protein
MDSSSVFPAIYISSLQHGEGKEQEQRRIQARECTESTAAMGTT